MALVTVECILTAFGVLCDEFFCVPVGTSNSLILKYLWFSSKILPIVRINAKSLQSSMKLNLVMLSEIVGAPYCLVVEHKEIVIVFQVMNQLNRDIFLRVSERAKPSIFTVYGVIWVVCTEFGLVIVSLEWSVLSTLYNCSTLLWALLHCSP